MLRIIQACRGRPAHNGMGARRVPLPKRVYSHKQLVDRVVQHVIAWSPFDHLGKLDEMVIIADSILE